jgi:hypothetical protein
VAARPGPVSVVAKRTGADAPGPDAGHADVLGAMPAWILRLASEYLASLVLRTDGSNRMTAA